MNGCHRKIAMIMFQRKMASQNRQKSEYTQPHTPRTPRQSRNSFDLPYAMATIHSILCVPIAKRTMCGNHMVRTRASSFLCFCHIHADVVSLWFGGNSYYYCCCCSPSSSLTTSFWGFSIVLFPLFSLSVSICFSRTLFPFHPRESANDGKFRSIKTLFSLNSM